jgi:hypothetical protein
MFESLRLFAFCQAMEWAALPVAGGLYDQHPQLLEEWTLIFKMKGDHEKYEAEKREREMERKARR